MVVICQQLLNTIAAMTLQNPHPGPPWVLDTRDVLITDLREAATSLAAGAQQPLADVNGHTVSLYAPDGSAPLHAHTGYEESFLVLEGSMFLETETAVHLLTAGEMATVARGVRHRTASCGGRAVCLILAGAREAA